MPDGDDNSIYGTLLPECWEKRNELDYDLMEDELVLIIGEMWYINMTT